MSVWYSVYTALRALAVNKGRTALTALGVIIGVAAVVLMVGLGKGFGGAITREINAGGANWVYVSPEDIFTGNPYALRPGRLTIFDVKALAHRFPDTIRTVVPATLSAATFKLGRRSMQGQLEGGSEGVQRLENVTLEHGRFYVPREVDGRVKVAVLGARIVEELTGSPHTDITGRTVFINGQAFRVVGTLKSKGAVLGSDHDTRAHIPYTTAMRRMMNTDNVTVACVEARSRETLPLVEEQISRFLRARHGIRPPYRDNDDFHVMTQASVVKQVAQVTTILSLLLGSIAAISLFVGGIGIMNIMLVSVTERTQEIGLRKAVGATVGAVMQQFLVESVIVSVLGGLAGAGLGLAALAGASAYIRTHALIEMSGAIGIAPVLMAFAVSASIGIVFGIYPAWRAARMEPITALRYE